MKYKYLTIVVPLMMLNSAYAQYSASRSAAEEVIVTSAYPEHSSPEFTPPTYAASLPFHDRNSYSGGEHTSPLYICIQGGGLIANTTSDSANFTGSGNPVRFELGFKYILPGGFNDAKSKIITVGLAYTEFTTNGHYTTSGTEKGTNTKFSIFSIPVSFYFTNKKNKVGYYLQCGLTANYNLTSVPDKFALITKVHRLWMEPTGSAGICFDYEHRDLEIRALLGPYVGYSVTNISNTASSILSFLTIGLKYTTYLP